MTVDDFTDWVNTFCYVVDELPGDTVAMAGADDGADALVLGLVDGEQDSLVARMDQLLAAPRTIAVMGTRVMWSPTAHGKSSPAWSLVIVTSDLQGWFGVRRITEDEHWWALPPDQAPWFMLSTASGLRAALTTGKPVTVKTAGENADHLFQRPAEAPHPPLDAQGRL